MKNHHRVSALAAAVFAVWCQGAAAVSIVFDYSYDSSGFFADATRRSTLAQAGSYLGSRLSDSLTAITSQGVNSFDAVFSNPTNSSTVTLNNYNVASNTLVVYVGAQNLGSSTLAFGGPGGYSASGTQSFIDNVASRGQAGALATPATDFGPWGGEITFNSTVGNWYFDTNTSTVEPFSGVDFFSVAVHELGHVLGVGTSDSWTTFTSGSNFVGPHSMSAFGGAVPLNSDLAHWAAGTTSSVNGSPQTAIMVPTIPSGTRRYYTNLDFAGLEDIGWQVTPVPLPAASWLLGSSLIGLLAVGRRKQS